MPQHPASVLVSAFKGLDNVLDAESTGIEFLKKALNIDLDKKGGIHARQGYTLKIANRFTSLWASENGLGCYGVYLSGGIYKLCQILPNYTIIDLKSNVGPEKVSFEEVDGVIYLSSNDFSGIIRNGVFQEWGIAKNTLSPTLTKVSGTLPSGDYQVTFTYVNSQGLESGTSRASIISVPNNSGISLFVPTSTNPDVTHARIYCSTQNGSILYYYGISTLGTSTTISSQNTLINPLITFNLDSPPLGHIVKYYRGRVYIAQGNILYYTEPFMYNHVNLSEGYIEFPETIREVMPVEDGIWIGSDKLYYLSGEDSDKFKRTVKEHTKVVSGSAVKFSGSYLHLDNTPVGYKWFVMTDLGVFILFNQGLVINMTATQFSPDLGDFGAGVFLQQRGMNHYLSMIKTKEDSNNASIGDLAIGSIIRNGVVIDSGI